MREFGLLNFTCILRQIRFAARRQGDERRDSIRHTARSEETDNADCRPDLSKYIVVGLAAIILPQAADARSSWVKMLGKELSCQATCSRAGMENVLFKRSGQSVCAQAYRQEAYPGANLRTGPHTCRSRIDGQIKIALTGKSSYCLCVDDGVAQGSDYAWVTALGSCRRTCRSARPKYGFAAYASAVGKSWLNVCVSKQGDIGFTMARKDGVDTETCSTGSQTAPFGCLCLQMYSGDLDRDRDP